MGSGGALEEEPFVADEGGGVAGAGVGEVGDYVGEDYVGEVGDCGGGVGGGVCYSHY